jgi:AcrR family transcriptional regulator
MPKLWTSTIEAHRNSVEQTIMEKTAELAATKGLANLTMAGIAQEAGIGRATLYKYFGDVHQILTTWHQRQIASHIAVLEDIRRKAETPTAALEGVLVAYGDILRQHHGHVLAPMLHKQPHARQAHARLGSFIAELIAAARPKPADSAAVKERAAFVLSAIGAAEAASSRATVQRLVKAILLGLELPS